MARKKRPVKKVKGMRLRYLVPGTIMECLADLHTQQVTCTHIPFEDLAALPYYSRHLVPFALGDRFVYLDYSPVDESKIDFGSGPMFFNRGRFSNTYVIKGMHVDPKDGESKLIYFCGSPKQLLTSFAARKI